MLERVERYLKLAGFVLVAVILYQTVKLATAPDPFATSGALPHFSAASPGGDPQGDVPELPQSAREMVDRITQSEILGPVPQPPPMALLGIGGEDVFLRAPNGQTGLLREGEELGGVKLIRIGVNRVLIEHEGRLEELIIFSGLGGDSLIPASIPNENLP